VAITDDGTLVVIRRERAGQPVYRVFPGGGMQASDRDEISALQRELDEEIAGNTTVCQLIYSHERTMSTGEHMRENFYLCRLKSFSLNGGSGPEWKNANPDNRYFVEVLAVDQDSLRGANLLPTEVVDLLIAAPDPFALPKIDV
jgi:8-oxo-dGTP pyrophosphatase MutT (NUDIX family)